MPEKLPMKAMIRLPDSHDEFVIGRTYFSNRFPWRSWRLAVATTIVDIRGNEVYYRRERYREWGNLYKLEEQYSGDVLQDNLEYFMEPSFYRYMAQEININKCIFKGKSETYVVGGLAKTAGKIHALKIEILKAWTGQDYPGVLYLCSGIRMRDLAELHLLENDRLTASFDNIKEQKEVITCKNCLRKIT